MRYRIDGKIYDTETATQHWAAAEDFDGRNYIDRSTNSQWDHQTLYRSPRGTYYLEHWSQYQGSTATAEVLPPAEAAAWLLEMDYCLPADLQQFADEILG